MHRVAVLIGVILIIVTTVAVAIVRLPLYLFLGLIGGKK